jgi:hypothetical protein
MITVTPTLIFVYNANGGVLSALGDMVHKIVSPATYPCSLCALTYGAVSMRREWRRFLDGAGLPSLFLYRDEFRSDLDMRDLALPAILLGGDASVPQVLVSADELGALPDLPALIALLEARLAARAV